MEINNGQAAKQQDKLWGESEMSGIKLLKKTSKFNFLKWGEYMKRANIAERKVQKLLQLLLLTDPVVWKVQMNELSRTQYQEYERWEKEQFS